MNPKRTRRAGLLTALVVGAAIVGLLLYLTGSRTQARLLTGSPQGEACYLSFVNGPLAADSEYGTAIVDNGRSVPVMWPDGYRARQTGAQVEVLDRSGRVVVQTGTAVHIPGGYAGESPGYWLACAMDPATTLPGQ